MTKEEMVESRDDYVDSITIKAGEIAITNIALSDSVTFFTSKGDITINLTTGEVSYPEDLPQAAKEFWETIRKVANEENHGRTS